MTILQTLLENEIHLLVNLCFI